MGTVHSRGTAPLGPALGDVVGASLPGAVRVAPRGFTALPGVLDAAKASLLVGVAILVLRVILAPILDPAANGLASTLSQTAAASLASAAVVLGLRSASGAHRHYGLRVLAGLLTVLALSVAESVEDVLPTNEWFLLGLFALASVMTVYELSPLIVHNVSRPVLVAASLDMVIFFASGLAIIGSIADWRGITVSDATIAVASCLIAMLAWTATSSTILFVRGVRFSLGGPYVMLGGLSLVAIAGASWIASTHSAELGQLAATDFVFSVGALMIARGWLTWSIDARDRPRAWLVELGRDMASTTAIMISVIVVVLGPKMGGSPSRIATVGEIGLLIGVLAAGIRQVAIKEYERRARFAEAATSARLVTEISDRGRVSRALEGVEPGDTARVTAERICQRLLVLPRADFVVVTSLHAMGGGVPLAASGAIGFGLAGVPLEAAQAQRLGAHAAEGAWSEPARLWLETWLPLDVLRDSPMSWHAPLVWDDHLVGILTIGSRDDGDAEAQRHEATAREAAVLVAALVGPALAAEAALHRRRERVERVIAEHRFHPVFQPIVDLATERIVGFEALTRFEEGGRPDAWFSEASAAGRGVELEVATLTAAVRESHALPIECYISLNLSAELASSVEVLGGVLNRIPHQVLLEITEHVQVEDYERMMASLYALDIQIRLAVDDAGAGYSGLQHILAIRPHVVKLDAALVRFVDVDVARQAIVGAMVSFASRTGCTIVAEGVETAAEVAMLRSLGVPLVQGYFYGRPRPAQEWIADMAARGSSSVSPAGGVTAATGTSDGVDPAYVPPVARPAGIQPASC